MEATRRRRATASTRGFLAGAGFLLTLLGVGFGLYRALEAADIGYPPIRLRFPIFIEEAARELDQKAHAGRVHRVAVLGDSTVMSYPPGKRVTDRLGQQLGRRRGARSGSGPQVRVIPITVKSFGPADYYFLSEIVARRRPEQVVMAFNIASLSENWRDRFASPQLVGWVPPGRLLEVLGLPIDWLGLTLDRVLLYQAIVLAGGYAPWLSLHSEQVRVARGAQDLTHWIDGTEPTEEAREGARPPPDAERLSHLRTTAAGLFGGAMAGVAVDHPVLRFLGAAVAVFERAESQVLVYAVPLNVEFIDNMKLLDESGLKRTLSSLEETVVANGGTFVDLHRLLPREGFRDVAGHFTAGENGSIDGPALVAERLAPVVTALRRSRGSGEN